MSSFLRLLGIVSPPSRRVAFRDLRVRLREVRRWGWDVDAAVRLKVAREAFVEAQGTLKACATCARGHELPHGRWDGGFCCGGRTSELFTDEELAGLVACGVRASALVLPRGSDHAGCVFRGPLGCSLAPLARPSICLWYLCRDVGRELAATGRGRPVGALATSLQEAFEAFVASIERAP